MENKTKLRTVREDKWERKEYITTCDSDDSENDAVIFLIRKFYCFRKGRHIYFKYVRHNHLRCPMMGEVSLEM